MVSFLIIRLFRRGHGGDAEASLFSRPDWLRRAGSLLRMKAGAATAAGQVCRRKSRADRVWPGPMSSLTTRMSMVSS